MVLWCVLLLVIAETSHVSVEPTWRDTVSSSLRNGWPLIALDLLALSEAVDHVRKVLSTLHHEDYQHSLEISVVLDDVLLE